MQKCIIGKKIGMTQLFDEKGNVVPVTVVEAGPCVVVQKKTIENDGYEAVQIGFGALSDKRATKAIKGHFAKADVALKKTLKEFRLDDIAALNGYITEGAGAAFKYLYAYQLTGGLDADGMAYLAQLGLDSLPALPSLSAMRWDNAPLTLDDDGYASLTLGAEVDSVLAGIGFSLYRVDEDSDAVLLLGTDNDITADWENGVFTDNFRGVWGSIDGCLVYMELSYEGEDYNLYSVPVLLNGEAYNLQVVYDFNDEAWSILGARQGIDDSGMADKELRKLQSGDELTTIWHMASLSDDSDFEAYEAETLTVTEGTAFTEMDLPDGEYMLLFEFWDTQGNSGTSQAVTFEVEGDDIFTSLYE